MTSLAGGQLTTLQAVRSVRNRTTLPVQGGSAEARVAATRAQPTAIRTHRLLLLGALWVGLLCLAGCGEAPPRPTLVHRPTAFYPEQFPDIPLPLGFAFMTDEDQLAVSLAGGTVRRYEVSMEQRAGQVERPIPDVLHELEGELAYRGWVRVRADAASQDWVKGNERLLITTGRNDTRTIIRYHLRPQPFGASAVPEAGRASH
jgi:hypothetical protein